MDNLWRITLEIKTNDDNIQLIYYKILLPDVKTEDWKIVQEDGKILIMVEGCFSLSRARGIINGILRQISLINDLLVSI